MRQRSCRLCCSFSSFLINPCPVFIQLFLPLLFTFLFDLTSFDCFVASRDLIILLNTRDNITDEYNYYYNYS